MSIRIGNNTIAGPAKPTALYLGSVYFSQSSSASDNPGALPLFTGAYFESGSSLYPDFYSWVKSHSELCKTKTEYDTAISTYGECPFYVVDEVDGSLRLPKLTNYIKNAGSEGITQAEAGLPNITGSHNGTPWAWSANGAFTLGSGTQTIPNGETTGRNSVDFDASQSNPIYGNSDTVTPAHTTLYPWVVAYNSAIPASTAQAAEFTNAVLQKADKNLQNVNWTNDSFVWLRNKSMELDWENVKNGAALGFATEGSYTVTIEADGLFCTNASTAITINGVSVFAANSSNVWTEIISPIPVKKGDVVYARVHPNNTYFIPYKLQSGTNELQFGLQYAGKFATASELDNVEKTQGLWALVGNDTDGYYRYYTKPTDNTFSAYEWAIGAKDITDGDYVVERVLNTDGSWYRKYKSGWVEQGGGVSVPESGPGQVTFLIPAKSGHIFQIQATTADSNPSQPPNITGRTETGFSIDYESASLSAKAIWYACGQGT